MIFDAFDRIRIINLPYRRDRRAEMKRELARVGLAGDPRVAFVPAMRPAERGPFESIGARGCYGSHQAILEEAAAAGESVLILEDDCDFTQAARGYEDAGSWDIFYGGYMTADLADPLRRSITGSHMMGFSAAGARALAAYLPAMPYDDVHPPVDGAYTTFRLTYPQVPVMFAEPPIAVQRSSRTDIAPLRFFDRLPLLRQAAAAARWVKRARRR